MKTQTSMALLLTLGLNLAMAAGPEKTPLPQKVKAFISKTLSKRAYSMKGVSNKEFIRKEKMLPRGAALLTSSGNLKAQGISAIIHAASGAMTKSGGVYEPTPVSVQDSIINSLILARRYKHHRVAIPFIGGGIFAGRMGVSKEVLAKLIVDSAFKYKKNLEIVFVTFNDSETALFKSVVVDLKLDKNKDVSVAQGSITDFSVHKASAIVNAANMEVIFGGGISGAIASASGKSDEIDAEAKKIIQSI